MNKMYILKTIAFSVGLYLVLLCVSHGIESSVFWGKVDAITVIDNESQDIIEAGKTVLKDPKFLALRFSLRMICYSASVIFVVSKVQNFLFLYAFIVVVTNFLLSRIFTCIGNVKAVSEYFALYLLEFALALVVSIVVVYLFQYLKTRWLHTAKDSKV